MGHDPLPRMYDEEEIMRKSEKARLRQEYTRILRESREIKNRSPDFSTDRESPLYSG